MSRRLHVGVFTREEDLLGATAAARCRGWTIVDAFTPYAVHGLDEALGLPPSRLGRVCLACGLAGAALAFWLQFWASAWDWPLNVGGRPWNSWPAFVPVAFELMVLLAGFGVVGALFVAARLYPGKKAALPVAGVTDDCFVLVLEEGPATDPDAVQQLWQDYRAVAAEVRVEDNTPPPCRSPTVRLRKWNIALGLALLVAVIGTGTLRHNPGRPNLEVMPEMVYSPAYDSFTANPNFPNGATLQAPPPGTIARGQLPLTYRPTPEDALRAGEELQNPFASDDARALARGAWIFANYCQVCHGSSGKGDGPVTRRGVPPPPPLQAEKALTMKDGQMFHVLTYGQGNMASYAGQLSRDDRWQVIVYLRKLQQPTPKGGKP